MAKQEDAATGSGGNGMRPSSSDMGKGGGGVSAHNLWEGVLG